MHAPENVFEAPPRTARVPDLPPPPADLGLLADLTAAFPPAFPPVSKPVGTVGPPSTGQRLLTPELAPHGPSPSGPGLPPDGPRLTPVASPARPNVMTLPPAAPRAVGTQSTNRPAAFNPAGLFDAPVDSIKKVRERQRRRRVRRLLNLLVLTALLAGGAVAYLKFRPLDDTPAVWDARVTELVQFVESNRALQFEHPVTIEFLPVEEYQARLRASWTDVSAEDRAEAAYEEELNDVFGLTATYRLLEDRGAIDSLSSLGFYSHDTDSIVVRGEQLTPGVKATVVHELTHALQAQHFDVGDRMGDRATRSVAEADAMEVEDAWLETLAPTDRWNASVESQMSPEDEAAMAKVPWTLVELEYAPYRLGKLAMDRRATGGNAGIDQALAAPPTERQMVSPWSPNPGSIRGLTAAAPTGATVVEQDRPMSTLETLVMFDAWLPWSMASSALDVWVGGVYTTYRTAEGGPLCAAVSMRSQVPKVIADAVTWWTAAMGAPVTPAVADTVVSFSLCARGKGATEPPRPVVPTTVAVELEISMIPADVLQAAIANGGLPQIADPTKPAPPTVGQYLCVARQVVDDPDLGPLVAEAFPTPQQQATIDKGVKAAVRACNG